MQCEDKGWGLEGAQRVSQPVCQGRAVQEAPANSGGGSWAHLSTGNEEAYGFQITSGWTWD